MSTLANHLVKFRWLYLIVSILVSLALSSGILSLEKKTGYRIFFPDDSSRLQSIDRRNDTFTTVDNIVFALEAINGVTFKDPEGLKAIHELTEKAWKTPNSTRVDSLTNFQSTSVDGDELVVQDLVSDVELLDDSYINSVVEHVNKEPSIRGHLVNDTWTATIIDVNLLLSEDGVIRIGQRDSAVNYARDILSELDGKYPNIIPRIIGQSVVNVEFDVMAERDTNTLGPIMLLLSALVFFILSRSFAVTLGSLFVVVLASLSANGFMAYTGFYLNQVTSAVGTIIMAIGICNCVHILQKYQITLKSFQSKHEAFTDALRQTIKPILIANITTCIGFLSLNFSEVPPFRDFGNISTVGIILAMFLSFTFFPAIALLGNTRPEQDSSTFIWGSLHNFVSTNQRSIIFGFSALFAASIFLGLQNKINDDPYKYFSQDTEIKTAADFVDKELSGITTVSYTLDSMKSDGITDIDFMSTVDQFVDFLHQHEGVTHVSSYLDVIKRLSRDLNGGDESFYKLPDSQEMASQYLLMYELSIPYGMDLTNQINFDKSQTLITAFVRDGDAARLTGIDTSGHDWMSNNAPNIGIESNSVTASFQYVGIDNVKAMIIGSSIALILAAIALIVSLKSIRLGLLSIIPNAFPACLTIGLWALYNGEANIGVATIFAITLGIVIDDTVHFTHHYIEGLNRGKSSSSAVLYAYHGVGKALFVTTLILALGFFVLSLSDFNVNSNLGLLVALTIIFAFVLDLVFYAPLLQRLFNEKHLSSDQDTCNSETNDKVVAS